MPIVAKLSRSKTPRERFRLFTESLLMEAAQRAMLERYPAAGARPYRRGGALRAGWGSALRPDQTGQIACYETRTF